MTDRWTTYLAGLHHAHSNSNITLNEEEGGSSDMHHTYWQWRIKIDLIKDEIIHVEKCENLKIM